MGALLGIVRLWRGQRLFLVGGLLVSLASLMAAVLLMVVGGGLVAAALTGGTLALSGLLKLTGAARVVLRYIERLATHSATFRALADTRVWFFCNLARTAAGGLGFVRSGDVLGRLVSDVEALDGLYLRILLPLAGGVLLLPLAVDFISQHDVRLAIAVAVLFVLAAFVLPWAAAANTMAAGQVLARAQTGLRTAVIDALGGLKEVRAYGAEGRMLASVQARDGALLAAQHALATRTALAGAAAFLCAQAAILAILVEAPVDTTWAIIAVFFAVAAFEAIGGLTRAGALAGHAAAAAARVLDVADLPEAAPDPAHPAKPPRASGLRFEAVDFHWPDRPPVFESLTLDVPEGAQVAILGASGSGKSTLAALALKLVAPHSGRILLGGVDIASLTAAEVRARIGWLSQTTHLFDDTIRRNLLLAQPDASEPALWAALEAARISDVVASLPDGLDTWVGEAGARFSGGQGRRLALARTLLSPAPLLILDEPAAGLDAETEREFLRTLTETTKGRTVVLIAHRLTGVERLDRLFRLSGGRAMAAAA
jgi:ATP-binding cassette subfamily C protein CydC